MRSFKKTAIIFMLAMLFFGAATAAFAEGGAGVVLDPVRGNVGARLGADGNLYYNYSDSTRAKVPIGSVANIVVNKAATLDGNPLFDKVVISYVSNTHTVIPDGADWDDVTYDVYSGGKKVTSGRGAFTGYLYGIFDVRYAVDKKSAIELPTADGGMFYFYTPGVLKEWDSSDIGKYDFTKGGTPNFEVTEGVNKSPVDGYHTGSYGTRKYTFYMTGDKKVYLYNETDDSNSRQALLVNTGSGSVEYKSSMPSSIENKITQAGAHGVRVVGLGGNTYKETTNLNVTTNSTDGDGYLFNGRGSDGALNFAGRAELAGGNITVNGTNSAGIHADGGYQEVNVAKTGGTITVNGEKSYGIYTAGKYASVKFNNGEIAVKNSSSLGVVADEGANVSLNGTKITVSGANSAGVAGLANTGTVTADKFDIAATGENSSAFYAAGNGTKLNAVKTGSAADSIKASYGAVVSDGAEISFTGVGLEGDKAVFYAAGDNGGTIKLYSSTAKGAAAVKNSNAALNLNIGKDSIWTLNKASELGTGKLTIAEGGTVKVVDEGKIAAATLEKGGKLALSPEKYLDANGVGVVSFNGGGTVSFSDGTLAENRNVTGADLVEIDGNVKANSAIAATDKIKINDTKSLEISADNLQSVVNNEAGTLTLLNGSTTKEINGAGETKVNAGSEVTFGAKVSNKITNAGYIYTGANYLDNTVTNSGTVEAVGGSFLNSGKIDGGTAILRKDVDFASNNLTASTTLDSQGAKYNFGATVQAGGSSIAADSLLDVKTASGTIKLGKVNLSGVDEIIESGELNTQMQYLSDGAITGGSTLIVDDDYIVAETGGIYFDFTQAYNTPWDTASGVKTGWMDVYAINSNFTLKDVIEAKKYGTNLNLGKVDSYVLTEDETYADGLGSLTRDTESPSTPRELTVMGLTGAEKLNGNGDIGITVAGNGGGAGDTLNMYDLTLDKFNRAIVNNSGGNVNLEGVNFTNAAGDYDVVNTGTLSTAGLIDLSAGIKNEAGGTVNLNDGTVILDNEDRSYEYDIENAGTVNASGTVTVDKGIRNSETGVLNADNADFASVDGEYEIVNDGTMNANGSVTFDTGLSGDGTLNVSGLAYTKGTIEQGNVSISGILDSDSNVTVSNELKLSNGALYIEPGHAAFAGTLAVEGASAITGEVLAEKASFGESAALLASGKIMSGNMNSYGVNNIIAADNTAVFGSNAVAQHKNSVVLGNGSVDRAPTGGAYGVVSVGNVGMERQIINVANGEISATSTDAVNGRQLYGLQEEARSIGAISAALAGLHFIEPSGEEGDKIVGAVAYGGYRGANAEAIGLAYKPNSDMMFSASTSISNGNDSQNAYNLGFSFKFGKGKTAKTRAELQKQVKYLNGKIETLESSKAAQDAEIQTLKSEIEELKRLIKK
ncbi:MAG: YadA-like family protein [Synergistaceae bacterium]|nr:YadA-like family protein [Synergistaceae bacterium]